MKDRPKQGAKFVWKETEKTDRNRHSHSYTENEEMTVTQEICRNGWKKQVCTTEDSGGSKESNRLDNQSINCNKQTLWTKS